MTETPFSEISPLGLHVLAQDDLLEMSQKGLKRSLEGSPTFCANADIDLTSNDYLGMRAALAHDRELFGLLKDLPPGSGGSRLLGGDHRIFHELETRFARFKNCDGALFFGSGYLANVGLHQLLARDDIAVFSDAANHASIIDGLRLARLGTKQKYIFRHLDYDHLEELIAQTNAPVKVIVTEATFSMDGDQASPQRLKKICTTYGASLIVDEAHSLGLEGEKGEGLFAFADFKDIDLISVNPCGKAVGVQGAFICGPTWVYEWLVSCCRTFIYSTAPSPWIAAALLVSLQRLTSEEGDKRRAKLRSVIAEFEQRQSALPAAKKFSPLSAIRPVILGSNERTMAAAKIFAEEQIKIRAIRPPTVPEGTSRLRVSLHTELSEEHISRILACLAEVENL